MRKILFTYFIFLLCFTSKAEASNTADKRIMGKNTNPHVVFQCHDINDPTAYLLGFTPVSHNDEPYYVVSYFKNRFKTDSLIALALIHHLAITKNIPINQIIHWIVDFAPTGLLEFIPPSDQMVRQMTYFRENLHEE